MTAVRESDDQAMRKALQLARSVGDHGDVPVGAVVCDPDDQIIGEGANQREQFGDPLAHAEIVAMRAAAARIGGWNLSYCTLVVTLEPCVMCAGALIQARISRLVFGAWDEKAGAVGSVYDLVRDRRLPVRAEVIAGVRQRESTELLSDFFQRRRS